MYDNNIYPVKCQCGAITVEIDGHYYSMTSETFDKKFPNLFSGDLEAQYQNCNHCVNHWGIDLCGCGCGQLFGECEDECEASSSPAQSIEDEVLGCYCEGGW